MIEYVHNIGVVTSTAWGLPFDHDASNQPLGILNEPQGENLFAWSNYPTLWQNDENVTPTNDQTEGPGGVNGTGFGLGKWVENTATGGHGRWQVPPSLGRCTQSIFCKELEGSAKRYMNLYIRQTTTTWVSVCFDLGAGTFQLATNGSNHSHITAGMEEYHPGVWRCWHEWETLSAVGACGWYLSTKPVMVPGTDDFGNDNYTGDGSSGMYVGWGDFTRNEFGVTSHIYTEASSEVRDPDYYELDRALLAPWGNVDFSNSASMSAKYTPLSFPTTNNRFCYLFHWNTDGTVNVGLRTNNAFNFKDTGGQSGNSLSLAFAGQLAEYAVAVDANLDELGGIFTHLSSMSGSSANNRGSVPGLAGSGTTLTFMRGGSTSGALLTGFEGHGHLEHLVVVPEARQQAEMNTLTTLD